MVDDDQNNFSRIGYRFLVPVVAVASGIAGAVGAAHTTIRNRFSKDIRLATSLQHINDPYYEDLDRYATEFFKDKTIDAKAWRKRQARARCLHAKELATELTERGFPSASSGIEGYLKEFSMRYEMMSPNSKRAIVVNSAITAAIGFGGIFTFFNNMQTRHYIDRMAHKQSPSNERQ
ncbi:MAG: hypothetical protein WDN72_06685 [Alphaproteobacteria bacterium]